MSDVSPHAVLQVIADLLGPDGCPWDKEQTPESLCDYLLEETFELVEAIRKGQDDEIKEELGDVFFLLFFLSTLLSKKGQMKGLQQVWLENAEKMKGRHPHVFATARLNSRDELHQKWEEVKKQEKKGQKGSDHPLASMQSIPASLPPLLRAYRLHSKAARAGFTWDSDQEQDQALQAEWEEWIQAVSQADDQAREEEFGDLLFSLVEQGRRHGVKANAALHLANLKFLRRLEQAVALAGERGQQWESLDMQTKEALWGEVKDRERK